MQRHSLQIGILTLLILLQGSLHLANAAKIYVLVPDDKDWLFDNLMISANGGAGETMSVAPDMCGWYTMTYEVPPEEVTFYHKNTPDEKIGVDGLAGAGENPTPLPFKEILDAFGVDTLYYIPDDSQWPDGGEDNQGLFLSDPAIDGVCYFNLAAVIYDTDCSVNKDLFSVYRGLGGDNEMGESARSECNDEGTYINGCSGFRTGIVATDLGPNNKPVLNVGSVNAQSCFGNDTALFNSLFNYRAGKNEVVCYDLPFSRANDGRWAFDSDNEVIGGNKGGFYPRENPADYEVVTSISPQMCPNCRKKSRADGPIAATIRYPGVHNWDYLCNGPGWTGGTNCNTYFVSDDTLVSYEWGMGSDGNPRWGEALRNQFFCLESHAKFTYQENQEFSFRSSDDLWVFINKKLAVDNGGTHLPAPGHVQLKQLNNTYGEGFLVPGAEYSLDIFFCDRRTSMSDMMIKANMFIKQTSGLSITPSSANSDGSISYNICYDRSGDGSCASVALGYSGQGIHTCGKDIEKYGILKYKILTRAGEETAELVSGQSGKQYGGFDLSDPFNPKVYQNKINKLPPGTYRLMIEFCDKNGRCEEKSRSYINFRIAGTLDIMTQTSTYTVNKGDTPSTFYKTGTKWTFVDKGLASVRVPVYVSAFAEGKVDLLGAVGQSYTLMLAAGMKAYATQTSPEEIKFPKTVNTSGIDTIWIEQTMAGMTSKQESKDVSLKSKATITFYVPELHFATPVGIDSEWNLNWEHPIAGDPDTVDGDEYFHWIGKDTDLYVLAINPITNDVCVECNFGLAQLDGSMGVNVTRISPLMDGFSVISIRSSREYVKKSTAYITIFVSDDANMLTDASYNNMRFREPTEKEDSDIDKPQDIHSTSQALLWSTHTNGRKIHVIGAKIGSSYAVLDMQGRVLTNGVVKKSNFAISTIISGQFIVKLDNQSRIIKVK